MHKAQQQRKQQPIGPTDRPAAAEAAPAPATYVYPPSRNSMCSAYIFQVVRGATIRRATFYVLSTGQMVLGLNFTFTSDIF